MAYRSFPVLAAILISFSLQAYAGTPATTPSVKPNTSPTQPPSGPALPPVPSNPSANPWQDQSQNQQQPLFPTPACAVNLLPAAVNGLNVYVNGTPSNSNGVAVSTIGCTWGDGQATTGVFPLAHTYSSSGEYAIAVTANFEDSNYASTSQTVNVGPGIVKNCLEQGISAGRGGSVSYKASIGGASVGTGTLSEGQSVILRLIPGAQVSLDETPNRGSSFSGWTSPGAATRLASSQTTFVVAASAAPSQITAEFRVTPAIDSSKSSVSKTSLTLPAGSQLYVFGMGTDGTGSSSAFAAGQSVSVSNADGIVSASLAAIAANADSYTTACRKSAIGGFGISGFSHVQGFYDAVPGPKANSASVSFALEEPAMVVLFGVAGGQQSLTFSGIDGLVNDVPANDTISLAIAHANLKAGKYTVKQTSPAAAAGRDPNHMTDLLGVLIFSNKDSPATSTNPPIPIASGKGYTSAPPP
jgi:hypothetical protein